MTAREPYKWTVYMMDNPNLVFETITRCTLFNQTYFVTRAKKPIIYVVVDTNYNKNDLVDVVGDRTNHLYRYVSERKYLEDLRQVELYSIEK